jgi:catechol 2,3-dioxygenase-like lactoylglutathione lyase family enzyme
VARIQHLAIASQDPEKQAAFYKDVFGFEEIRRIDNPRARGVILTDGAINKGPESSLFDIADHAWIGAAPAKQAAE